MHKYRLPPRLLSNFFFSHIPSIPSNSLAPGPSPTTPAGFARRSYCRLLVFGLVTPRSDLVPRIWNQADSCDDRLQLQRRLPARELPTMYCDRLCVLGSIVAGTPDIESALTSPSSTLSPTSSLSSTSCHCGRICLMGSVCERPAIGTATTKPAAKYSPDRCRRSLDQSNGRNASRPERRSFRCAANAPARG